MTTRQSLAGSNSRRGFSLTELLVVVIILSIAAAMILPGSVNGQQLQITSAARLITGDLQYAQSTAITYQKHVRVSLDTVNEKYDLATVTASTSTPLIHPITKSDYRVDFKNNGQLNQVNIYSVNFGGQNYVEFDELGSPVCQGTIVLKSGASVYTITVAVGTGKITVTPS